MIPKTVAEMGINYIGAIEDGGERIATITRRESFSGRASLRPWKWLYDVQLDFAPRLAGFNSLATAERMARKHGATTLVCNWK